MYKLSNDYSRCFGAPDLKECGRCLRKKPPVRHAVYSWIMGGNIVDGECLDFIDGYTENRREKCLIPK